MAGPKHSHRRPFRWPAGAVGRRDHLHARYGGWRRCGGRFSRLAGRHAVGQRLLIRALRRFVGERLDWRPDDHGHRSFQRLHLRSCDCGQRLQIVGAAISVPVQVVLGTIGPGTASFVATAAAGTIIATLTGKSSGSTLSLSPNDGRVVLDSAQTAPCGGHDSHVGGYDHQLHRH